MASENLVKELWEIIQKENKEEISYNDFEKDLNKVLNLPKDESDRALSLMISQAEVNPNVIGEYKGGSFMISQSFAATVASTIKYENQFIPGKIEYNIINQERFVKDDLIDSIIITPLLISQMIDNFENLSSNEVMTLASKFYQMSSRDKERFLKAQKDNIKKDKENAKTQGGKEAFEELEEIVEGTNTVHSKMQKGQLSQKERDAYSKEIMKNDGFKKFYFDIKGVNLEDGFEVTDEIIDLWISYGMRTVEEARSIASFYEMAQRAIENNNLEEFANLCAKYPKEAERYLIEFQNNAEKLGIDLRKLFSESLLEQLGFDNVSMMKKGEQRKEDTTQKKDGDETYLGSDLEEKHSALNNPFLVFISALPTLNETEKIAVLRNEYVYGFVESGKLREIHEGISVKNLYTEEITDTLEAQKKMFLFDREEVEQLGEAIHTLDEEYSNELLFYEMDEMTTDVEIEMDETESIEQDHSSQKINNELSIPDKQNYKKSTYQINFVSNEDKAYVKNSEIQRYMEQNGEYMHVAGEKNSTQTLSSDENDGVPRGTIDTEIVREQLRSIDEKFKGRRIANKIVNVLRLIGSVRSGDVRDAQQAVTSLTKVGKNLEEATQTADEVEQGE